MVGVFFIYCLIGAVLGMIYYANIKRNPKYKIKDDNIFLTIIALVCAPFVAPVVLALYLVWKFCNREEE